MTLVEYGSYACPHCHAAHEVIADLRDRFGDRLQYVFRHRPVVDSDDAQRAAELAEYASETTRRFWEVHDVLMKRGPTFTDDEFREITKEFDLPAHEEPYICRHGKLQSCGCKRIPKAHSAAARW